MNKNKLTCDLRIVSHFCINKFGNFKRGNFTIRADFQQGMESVSSFKINTVTENYWLIYAAMDDLIMWGII